METRNTRRRKRRRSIGVGKALAVSIYVVFLIAFLLASSASAVPLSRSLKTVEAPHVIPDLSAQQTGSWEFGEYEEEGRKLLDETKDYGDTGANNKHDPPR